MRRATATVLAFEAFLCLATSCGGSGSHPGDDISECRPSWKVLLEVSDNLGRIDSDKLVWSNDRVYFVYIDLVQDPSRQVIASISSADSSRGDLRQVESPASSWWWIEDGQLTYISDDGLFGMPLDGSAPAQRQIEPSLFVENHSYEFGLDAEALFWSDISSPYLSATQTMNWSVWRASRSTSERIKLADMPAPYAGVIDRLILTPDRILLLEGHGLGGGTNTLYALPKGGGNPQVLATSTTASVVGVAQDGSALWQEYSPGTTEISKLWRSSGDGAASVEVWADRPEGAYVIEAWSDDNGGWYMVGWEGFETWVTSVWRLDGSGQVSRITCNQAPPDSFTYPIAGTLSPSALYVLSDLHRTRSIVSIARQP